MAAAVLSGPSAGSAAGVPGGTGGLSAVGSVPRLRLLLLESVSGLLQPRVGSSIAPVHPPVRSAPHLPGLVCLLRLHGTVGGAQVSLWAAYPPCCWNVGAAPVHQVHGELQLQQGVGRKESWGPKADPVISVGEIDVFVLYQPRVGTQRRGWALFLCCWGSDSHASMRLVPSPISH